MPIAAVVGDANVFLSAVIGKAALRVFTELSGASLHPTLAGRRSPPTLRHPGSEFGVEVHVCNFNADEIREYLPRMAGKYRLPLDLVELQLRLLPMRLHPEADYAHHLGAARTDLAARDPDDAHQLALARALGLPLWSNDRDLDAHGVECFTTARLLKVLTG